jgi:hypothetical protein
MRALRMGLLTAVAAFAATIAVATALSGPSPRETTAWGRLGSIAWLSLMLGPIPTALGFLVGSSVDAMLGKSSADASRGARRPPRESV